MHFLHGRNDERFIVQLQHLPIFEVTQTTRYPSDHTGLIMAYVTETRALRLPRIDAWIDAMRERRARNRVYRKTIAELRSLRANELADLGIHHSMIRRLAWEEAYGR
jgi:uncharacterized protein YjiS (DUF1127 family)